MAKWRWLAAVVVAVAVGVGSCAVLGDFASDDPGLARGPGRFEGRFLAVSDVDMAATAYADGRLEPLDGQRDELALLGNGAIATAHASNSVVSWPQVVDASPDGRFAAVVEARGPRKPGVAAYEDVSTDFPIGARISIFKIEPGGLRRIESRANLGLNLGSVEYAPTGTFLVIRSETPGQELLIVALRADGAIEDVRGYSIQPVYHDDDVEGKIRTVHIAPDGETLALNIANRRVQFYRLMRDERGQPMGVAPFGSATANLGRRLSIGKWTPDGRHFLTADTNGVGGARALVQGPGAIIALRPPQDAHSAPEIASRVEVGRFPEGFDISPDGRRVAAVGLERTYLPEWPLFAVWPGRRRYSLSLLSFDPQSGRLRELDRVRQAGILPEDVIFDATGRNLAVAVFHRRTGPDRRRGFVDFFAIENGERLASQGVTQGLTRGVHDLVRVP